MTLPFAQDPLRRQEWQEKIAGFDQQFQQNLRLTIKDVKEEHQFEEEGPHAPVPWTDEPGTLQDLLQQYNVEHPSSNLLPS